MDCSNKLNSKLFVDSKICQKISCGRTKGEAIVTSVLGPKTLELTLSEIGNAHFAIQTDTSNRKNVKLFPLCVQYFCKNDGLCNKIIDFYENADETADGMLNAIQNSLNRLRLSFRNVSALSADNTNSNFGSKHSLYTNIFKVNNTILKGNCHTHILHNCFKHALQSLDIVVENVVLKIYDHFSTSAKRREQLIEFCNFAQTEFKEILRHITTRWLSINPCVERLLTNWAALCSYFLSLNDCPKVLQSVLNISSESTEVPPKVEIYLLFVYHVSQLFETSIKKIRKQ